MQSNDDNINRQDPLDRLPQELITHSLLFLPPTSRCVSNSICKDWRETVLSVPLLHREIDLSRMGQDPKVEISPQDPLFALGTPIFKYALLRFLPIESLISSALVSKQWRKNLSSHWTILGEDRREILRRLVDTAQLNRILSHLHRISSLALERVTKISLNLSSFFHEFDVWWRSDQKETWGPIGLSRLSVALPRYEEHLEEINVRVDGIRSEDHQDVALMLSLLLEGLVNFKKLKKIQVEAPMVVALVAQGEVEGNLKSISIASIDKSKPVLSFEDSPYHAMVRQVEAFVGPQACFTQLCLPPQGERDDSFPEDLKIYQKLDISKSRLQELNLGRISSVDHVKAWDLSMQCLQLEACSFNFMRSEVLEDEELVFPSKGPLKLKKLQLFGHLRQFVSCASMMDWIGNQLEEITLVILRIQTSPDAPSSNFFSLLLTCKDTLKLIHLTGYIIDEQAYPEIEMEEFFPNLETLKIESFSLSPLQFFSNTQLPKLKEIDLIIYLVGKDSYSLVDHLMTLFNHCNSSLISIDLGFRGFDDVEVPPLASNFSFPRLENLRLGSIDAKESSKWTKWFSNFSYPSLVKLTPINEIIHRQFRENAPRLNFNRLSEDLERVISQISIDFPKN